MKEYDSNSWRNKVHRFGKYLVPNACFLPQFRTAPAPRRQLSLSQLTGCQSDAVQVQVVSRDLPLPPGEVPLIHRRKKTSHPLAPTFGHETLVATIARGASVGRSCILVAPHGNAVRETGYCLDRRVFGPFTCRKLNPRYWRYRYRGDLTARYRLPEQVYARGRIVALNNLVSHNFYHWMVEVAPRIAAVQLANIEADGFLVDHQSGYQRRVLQMLGIPTSKLIQPHCRLHLTADELIWVSHPGLEPLRHFIKMLEPSIPKAATRNQPRFVYISRRKAVHRRLINEAELECRLAKLGFESYCFEDLSIDRQLSLIHDADLIVTVHGAALANTMFAQPGTSIVEIFPERRGNIDLYSNWSRIHGLEHQVVMATSSRYRQRLHVDIDDVQLAVESSHAWRRSYVPARIVA